MKATRPDLSSLTRRLPDIPRWVETRGMLLSGRCETFRSDEDGFVVRGTSGKLVSVVGAPAQSDILAAVARTGDGAEVLATPEACAHVDRALLGWVAQPAIIHGLPTWSPTGEVENVQLLDQVPAGLPEELGAELESAIRWHPVAATFVSGKPVSFCYAAAETETLWDVSIDTLEAHRRRGYAASCVRFLIGHMAPRGRAPVWGALDSNAASLGLASKLGFQPVDRLLLYTRTR